LRNTIFVNLDYKRWQ